MVVLTLTMRRRFSPASKSSRPATACAGAEGAVRAIRSPDRCPAQSCLHGWAAALASLIPTEGQPPIVSVEAGVPRFAPLGLNTYTQEAGRREQLQPQSRNVAVPKYVRFVTPVARRP